MWKEESKEAGAMNSVSNDVMYFFSCMLEAVYLLLDLTISFRISVVKVA